MIFSNLFLTQSRLKNVKQPTRVNRATAAITPTTIAAIVPPDDIADSCVLENSVAVVDKMADDHECAVRIGNVVVGNVADGVDAVSDDVVSLVTVDSPLKHNLFNSSLFSIPAQVAGSHEATPF